MGVLKEANELGRVRSGTVNRGADIFENIAFRKKKKSRPLKMIWKQTHNHTCPVT